MEFSIPAFEFWSCFYTAVGAAVFWGLKGQSNLRAYCLSSIIDLIFCRYDHEKARNFVEFIVFLAIGVVVGVGLTQPHSPAQAIAAGLGWTGLVSYHPRDDTSAS